MHKTSRGAGGRRNIFPLALAPVILGLLFNAAGNGPGPGKTGAGTPWAAPEYKVIAVKDGGRIVGVVRFADKYPRRAKIRVMKDNAVCGAFKRSEKFIVNPENKGLMNALVTVEGITSGKAPAPAKTLQIEQKGCTYIPHFQVAEIGPDGVDLKIINSDGIFHNVHGYEKKETVFNMAHMPGTQALSHKLTDAGVVAVKCDVHPWMNGFIVLLKNKPYYATTDEDGRFSIADVPAGSYTLKVWHEGLGEMTKDVTVAAGQDAEVEFAIKPRKRSAKRKK